MRVKAGAPMLPCHAAPALDLAQLPLVQGSPCRRAGRAFARQCRAMADASPLAAARARVDALAAELAADEQSEPRLVETPISWVLLARSLAYKIKKPVRLPFLDFTTLVARRRYCDEELRLNRRFAPSLYLDVVEIRDSTRGASLVGSGVALDVAVRMRRFADGALWSERIGAGSLSHADVRAFAARLAAAHRSAAVAPSDGAFGTVAAHARIAKDSIAAIDAWQRARSGRLAEWPALGEWLERECARLAPHWAARLALGHVRECHGDLHLANVVELDDGPQAFDAIEFDPMLRWIDPLDDAAFLVMDLLTHGRRDLAFTFLDCYLEASGDHAGLPALRFFLVSRAFVRAQVSALCAARGIAMQSAADAADYLRLAATIAAGADPRLAITHGLPGSGKSYVSAHLLQDAGAIRVRSDVERKRLFGVEPLQSTRDLVPERIYGQAATRRTYAHLRDLAEISLRAGWPTIVDAAFLRRAERTAFAALATDAAVPFAIVDCRAALPLLRERVTARAADGNDPSEADVVVLERLAAAAEPLTADEQARTIVVDAAGPPPIADIARRWQAAR
jgi:aminoglycoside phosphotransferase family enzyme/predicted kinase